MNQKRPPIVTVLGHVDHGKTTLLDTIRKTRVAAREAGGITQGIGASKVKFGDSFITFIDTPGHKAFSKMRERGAKIADIAILVVAADDGPMPQTREALSYLKESRTPMIVALTKTDLPSASVEKALGSMEQEGVYFESRGGDTPFVEVSAKNGTGIDDLLEMINLVSDVNDLNTVKDELEAVVIETNKDNRGPVISVVVKNGVLKAGSTVYAITDQVKIRGMFDESGKSVKEAKAGDPVVILGFADLPEVGTYLTLSPQTEGSKKDDVPKSELAEDELGIVLKVKSAGSIDAIKSSLPEKAKVLLSDVGDVTESDVFFAKAADAPIFAFEAKLPNRVKTLAETEKVDVYIFDIIYKLLEEIEAILESGRTKYSAKLEILAKFPYNKLLVAGSKVLEGTLDKADSLILVRGEREVGKVKIKSLRSEKSEIDQAKAGQECGILFVPQLDFEVGDKLLAVKK